MPTKNLEWEKEFDNFWFKELDGRISIGRETIQDFIHKTLSTQRTADLEQFINDLETNPQPRINWAEMTLQYWIEAKQQELRKKYLKSLQ